MTENEATGWIAERYPTDAQDRLAQLVALVVEENARQNLVSRTSIETIWTRPVVDSVQLDRLVEPTGSWLDIGTGAGFPGLAIACVRGEPMTLVEPRPLRAAFLERAAHALRLSNVTVACAKVASMNVIHSIVSARAVASVDRLFAMSRDVADARTRYVFPRGRQARIEVADVQRNWRGVFHVEQSLSDADAAIIVARDVAPR